MKRSKNSITEMVFILDRSGSIAGLEADTIGVVKSKRISRIGNKVMNNETE